MPEEQLELEAGSEEVEGAEAQAEPSPATADPTAEKIARLEAMVETLSQRKGADPEDVTAASVAMFQRMIEEGKRNAPQEPDLPDYPSLSDEDAEDPRRVREYARRVAQIAEERVRRQYAPLVETFEQRLQQLQNMTGATHEVSQAVAKREAKEMVENAGYSDFDELWPDVQKILSMNQQGSVLRTRPDALRLAYIQARLAKGLPMTAPAKPAARKTASASTPGTSDSRSAKRETAKRQLADDAAKVAKILGIDSLEPSEITVENFVREMS